MIRGFVVPHAPVLLDLPGRPHPDPSTLIAVRSLDLTGCDVVVVCSPHGPATGVYGGLEGDLAGQGLDGFSIAGRADKGSIQDLSDAWGHPVLEGPVDHGIVVPWLLLGQPQVPATACCLKGWTGQSEGSPNDAIDDARSLAEALRSWAGDRTVGFVASAHGSAALTPKAPLTERREGIELERRLTKAFAEDVGSLAEIPAELWRTAGACGAGPLTALGMLCDAVLTPGRAKLFSYTEPFGVGYRVVAV